MAYSFDPIATVSSCFDAKFGAPRQAGLVPAAEGTVTLLPHCNAPETVRELDGFSHIWLVFVFHLSAHQGWRPTVRPPRLGGNRRVGVFATRSPFRPNPIGISAVRLIGVDTCNGVTLHVGGLDLADGTPILDIKPYIGYADCIEDAQCGFAAHRPAGKLVVEFAPEAEATCRALEQDIPNVRRLVVETLQMDPRPSYRTDADAQTYGLTLHGLNVRWHVVGNQVVVTDIEPASQ